MNILVSKRLDRWRRHISEKRSKSRIYCIPVKPFIWFQTTVKKTDGKTKMFHKFSPYFLHIFFQFSPNFPNDKTELFPSSPVDGCLQEHWDWQDFLLQGMLPVQKLINRLHDFCVNRSCTCCGNLLETSHMTSRVCVCACVRMNFSAIYRLVPCLKA